MKNLYNGRLSLLLSVSVLYTVLSLMVRIVFFILSLNNLDFNLIDFFKIFGLGFVFDVTVALFFVAGYTLYLLLLPQRWIGSVFDKVYTYACICIILTIIYFSLMAEFPFWGEFGVRFNFIAVDYLIYTYEVVSNINESYPLPLIITVLVALVVLTFILLRKAGVFKRTFSDKRPIAIRLVYTIPVLLITFLLGTLVKNRQADSGNNLTVNELSKNGVFSFFAAFRSNELDYKTFYPELPQKEVYTILKKNLLQKNQTYTSDKWDNITRFTQSKNENRPNIILITIESFSAEFLSAFGNENNITPNYDSLANQSIFFTNLYATGTRTVRGMEALTLSVPPTPGNSIVRRPNNQNLFSIATILKQKNYHMYFVYGGDGYFDNMNTFFGGQGFDIIDRDRGNPLPEKIATHRYNIPSGEVSFENAWGVCDEDLYEQAIKCADKSDNANRPFFQFIMTTSNHRPYTFPDGKIDLKQGNRNSAVKYTDYALGKFIAIAKEKSWFNNTVFVIVADHCASSAGKWEIDIRKHHIPAIIYNLHHQPERINRLASQIDLMPTLFGYLGWSYNTAFYGKDINQIKADDERAFIGNYRTLGLLKGNLFTQIDDRKSVKQFNVSGKDLSLSEIKTRNKALASETISYYETASERFKSGKMKTKLTR